MEYRIVPEFIKYVHLWNIELYLRSFNMYIYFMK